MPTSSECNANNFLYQSQLPRHNQQLDQEQQQPDSATFFPFPQSSVPNAFGESDNNDNDEQELPNSQASQSRSTSFEYGESDEDDELIQVKPEPTQSASTGQLMAGVPVVMSGSGSDYSAHSLQAPSDEQSGNTSPDSGSVDVDAESGCEETCTAKTVSSGRAAGQSSAPQQGAWQTTQQQGHTVSKLLHSGQQLHLPGQVQSQDVGHPGQLHAGEHQVMGGDFVSHTALLG